MIMDVAAHPKHSLNWNLPLTRPPTANNGRGTSAEEVLSALHAFNRRVQRIEIRLLFFAPANNNQRRSASRRALSPSSVSPCLRGGIVILPNNTFLVNHPLPPPTSPPHPSPPGP